MASSVVSKLLPRSILSTSSHNSSIMDDDSDYDCLNDDVEHDHDLLNFNKSRKQKQTNQNNNDTMQCDNPASDENDNGNKNQDGSDQQHQHDSSNNDATGSSSNEFQLAIPAFLLSATGESLAQMDQDTLAACLEPVMQSLRDLDAESLLSLHRVENGARLCDGVNIRPIHDEVHPRYQSPEGMSFVRYIHITEVPDQYSVGIFIFPPFARIPLHDHPEMCVLSRLLYGDLQCLSLDLLDDDNDGDEATPQQHQQQQLPPGFPQGSRRVLKNPIRHLHAPDVSMLFPYKGNLHEFFAGPHGAAVLDILLPPYDANDDRDCTFYDVRENPVPSPVLSPAMSLQLQQQHQGLQGLNPMMMNMMMDVDPSQAAHSSAILNNNPLSVVANNTSNNTPARSDGRAPCWIVPTSQPHDFHCLSGKYKRLGNHVISMQDG